MFKVKNLLVMFLLFFVGLFSIKIILRYLNHSEQAFSYLSEGKEVFFIALVVSVLTTFVNKMYVLKGDSK